MLSQFTLFLVLQVGASLLDRVERTPLKSGDEIIDRVKYERPIELRLDGMHLTRRQWTFRDFRHLRALSLRGTNFTDAQMPMVASLKELRFLDLSSTAVTDETLHLLGQLPQLRALCLTDVDVTPQAVARLKQQFKDSGRNALLVGYSPRGEQRPVETQSGLLCCQPDQPRLEVFQANAPTEEEMKPYDELIEHTEVKIRMIPIPGGEFLMGSPAAEPNRTDDEGPQHKVTISPFWMAETETTWDAFLVWVKDLDIDTRKELNLLATIRDRRADAFQLRQPEMAYYKEDMGMGFEGRPAIRMTQLAARTYCQWLSAKTGRYYRLPTEAEWEYACRAGTVTAYSWGDDPKQFDEYAWCFENTDADHTGKVRQKKPNPWGLYDMHGNVSEWVLDQFEPHFYERNGVRTDPLNVPQTLYSRVVRGGSFQDDADQLRSANRQQSSEEWMNGEPRVPHGIWWHRGTHYWFGFRVVRPLVEPTEVEKLTKWDAQQPSGQRERYLER